MNTLLHLDIETLPASLVLKEPLTDGEFEALCLGNDVIQFERSKRGEIVMHSPTGGSTPNGNAEITLQLGNWWKTHRRGKVYDSSAGFFLTDGSMLSPDAAYVAPATLAGAPAKSDKGIPHLCPDFVIELLSRSDSLRETEAKMQNWISNGVALAWLIDPYREHVTVYRPHAEPLEVTDDSIQGSGPVEGFLLDVKEVWSCYEG